MILRDRVLAAAAERGNVERSQVNDDTAIEALGIDSLTFMDLVMSLEDQENVNLSDVEIEKLLSVMRLGELVSVFESAKAHASSRLGGSPAPHPSSG